MYFIYSCFSKKLFLYFFSFKLQQSPQKFICKNYFPIYGEKNKHLQDYAECYGKKRNKTLMLKTLIFHKN